MTESPPAGLLDSDASRVFIAVRPQCRSDPFGREISTRRPDGEHMPQSLAFSKTFVYF